jgi:fatty acid desaturase
MKVPHCAVFDPDHYNIVDITDYEKYRQHIEQQREMESQKAKAKRKRERQRKKLIAQRIFCVMLMGVGYLLIRYASDTWPLGVTFILFGLLVITERKAILW